MATIFIVAEGVLDQLRSRWTTDDAGNLFGRDLYMRVPERERPAWAAGVLDASISALPPVPELEEAVRVAFDSDSWPEARRVFDAIRQLTLAAERAGRADPLRRALLDLGETTAKVTYNASGYPAPYDDHAGWGLAPRAKRLVEHTKNEELEDRVWRALIWPLAAAT